MLDLKSDTIANSSITQVKSTNQFDVVIKDPFTPIEFEIRLSNTVPLGKYVPDPFFLEMTMETFMIEPRTVRPAEFFFLNAVEDTLTLSTKVIVASSHAASSTIIETGDWLQKCVMQPNSEYRIPLAITDIHL